MINLKQLGSLTLIGLILSACGGGGGASSSSTTTGGGGGNTPSVATPLTIDNTGTIPVLGDSATSTVVYIHNNSNVTLNGIIYTAQLNNTVQASGLVAKLLAKFKAFADSSQSFINPTSAGLCSSIPAFQSCPLTITTPTLGTSSQGSALLKASYTANGKATSFSNIINYSRVYDNPTNGAVFASGVQLNSFGHSTGYATVYAYGSGQGQIYTVDSFTTSKAAISIVQGNLTGRQLQSNYVQAVEISSPALNSGVTATLKAVSNANNRVYTNTTSVGVSPIGGGAVLTAGLIPLLNSVTNNTATMYVTNSGNESAVVATATLASPLTAGANSCNGTTLAPGGNCSISFTVPQLGGSASITLPYSSSGGSNTLSQIATWYNGTGGALLQMTAADNPLIFNATESNTTTVTVRNLGGYALTNLTIPVPRLVSGSAVAELITPDTCTGQNLAIGATCDYTVRLTDSATDISRRVDLFISGSYTSNSGAQTYLRAMALSYTSNPYAALLAFTPTPVQMSITGNNVESETQVLRVNNIGQLPATLVSESFPTIAYLTDISTCGATLPANESCVLTFKLGPTIAATLVESTAPYVITYSGGGQTVANTTVTANIPYQVLPNGQSIIIESVVVTNYASGNGSSATPYIFAGSNTSAKSVIFTLQNAGTNPIKVTGVQNVSSIYAWNLESATNLSTCLNYSATLAVGATCSLVYTNVLAANSAALAGAGIGSTYVENIVAPEVIFQDTVAAPQQFRVTPSLPTPTYTGTTLYVTGTQATLVNQITVQNQGLSSESVTVSNQLANATAYAPITVTALLEDYFSSTSAISGACTATPESGLVTQVCTLTPSGSTASSSVTYNVNRAYVFESTPLTGLFSADTPQVLSISPSVITVMLNKIESGQ